MAAASNSRTIEVADALLGPDFTPAGPARISIAGGMITSVETGIGSVRSRLLAMPALTDAHNHGYGLATSSYGTGFRPLETWIPSLAKAPAVDPYLAMAVSLGRSARGGCAGVMVHLTRAMGKTPIADEAREIARAAGDVGVAIGLAISLKDRNPLVYGDHGPLLAGLSGEARHVVEQVWAAPAKDQAEQLEAVDDVFDAVADTGARVDVQYGPNGVQWCSDAMLRSIAGRSEAKSRRVHMHLLETRLQREWADRNFPQGIVSYLREIGLLSPRLTLAHCVWARQDELEMIAESGARISVNPSSNLHLYSGIAPAVAMHAAGVPVGLGLDGYGFDEDSDALREMRLFSLLNRGWSFDGGLGVSDALATACVNGRATVGLQGGGVLAEGEPADLLLLDIDALDRDGLDTDGQLGVDIRHLLVNRATLRDVSQVIAGGHTIVRDGDLTGIDFGALEKDLRRQSRSATPAHAPVIAAWRQLEPAIRRYYGDHFGCC
jgi:cytosine/adenosine deaminase-related metal-dependent hydrolase